MNLPEEDVKKIINHPSDGASKFLESNLNCPNADKIILYHHELPDGSGFPQGLNSFNIPPYACLFIIAEEVVRALFHYEFKEAAWDYLEEKITSEYISGNFGKPAQGFLSCFIT